MSSYLSDDIEHEAAIEDDKREGTCVIIFFLNFVSNILVMVFS